MTDVPQGFKDWIKDNEEGIERAEKRGTLPYFIRDNKGEVDRILHPDKEAENTAQSKIAESAKATAVNPKPEPQKPTAQEKNHQELAKALDIKQGEPMSFDEANELRGNPNYDKDEIYRVNCQTCVVANELRRRGFDVQALGNTKGSMLDELSKATNKIWFDEEGKIPEKSRAGGWYFKKGSIKEFYKTPKQTMTEFMELTSTPGRYHLDWKWKQKSDGHIITFERLSDGTGFFYDPQTGKKYASFPWLSKVSPKYGIKVLRVDDKRIDVDWASKILERAGGKAKNGIAGGGGVTGNPLTESQKQRKEEIKKQLLSEPKKEYHCALFKTDLSFPNKSVKEWLNQPHVAYDAKNEAILDLQNILDKCDTKIDIPVKPKHAESVGHAYALPISVDSKDSWIIIHEMKWGEVKIYGISDDKRILEK